MPKPPAPPPELGRALQLKSRGPDVVRWQTFLRGRGYQVLVDGNFLAATDTATRDYQAQHSLKIDGVVGNRTIGTALTEGYQLFAVPGDEHPAPQKSLREALLITPRQRELALGKFDFKLTPTEGNHEHIDIDQIWVEEHLVLVSLLGIHARIHRRCVASFRALWAEVAVAELADRVLKWNGSFEPRLTRGSSRVSMHAWGAAFDINASENKLGHMPPLLGEIGCVRELVPIAQKHGWYWGGDFRSRQDGMHFEATSLALEPLPEPVHG